MLFNIASIIICVILVCVFIYLRIAEGGVSALISKILASFVFVVAGLVAFTKCGIHQDVMVFIPIGLICGLIGDTLLDLKVVYPIDKKPYFYSGTIAFALGHLCYASAICVVAAKDFNIATPLLVSIAIGLGVATLIMLLADKFGIFFKEYFWISYLYCFILATMVALSIYLCVLDISFICFAIGMGLFFASDLVLSTQYFGKPEQEHSPMLVAVNHMLYYVAQIMVVAFIMFV